jgi:hypothetical protein
LAVVEVDFGIDLLDELLEGEFEVVSLFSLEEEALNCHFRRIDADEDGAAVRVQKGHDGFEYAPFRGILFYGKTVVLVLDGTVGRSKLFAYFKCSSATKTGTIIHVLSLTPKL